MKVIISPAKKMNENTEIFEYRNLPCFIDETKALADYVRGLDYEQAKALWKCSDSIARLNCQRFQDMDLEKRLTPALLAYEGIQYRYMAPNVFEYKQWDYIEEHLYILSGFYGILRPFDGVVPYRLEMQAKVTLPGKKDLYDYWGDKIYKRAARHTDCIINLASKEYSKCIEPYLSPDLRFITCIFGEWKDGRVIEKGTMVKMARGEMVRFMAEKQIEDVSELKGFQGLGYRYHEKLSDEKRYVFVKEQDGDRMKR